MLPLAPCRTAYTSFRLPLGKALCVLRKVMRKNQRNERSEGPIIGFCMGQLAATFFAIPTAALLWFATNKHLAI